MVSKLENSFKIHKISMSETKSIIRSVCNRGYNIPMELFKPIASYIASPLTVVRKYPA